MSTNARAKGALAVSSVTYCVSFSKSGIFVLWAVWVENISIFDKFPENQKVNYKFIGIAFENYSILEINQDMYILNQRKAKERILYEALKNNYYNEKQNSSQLLLLPDVITLSKKDME